MFSFYFVCELTNVLVLRKLDIFRTIVFKDNQPRESRRPRLLPRLMICFSFFRFLCLLPKERYHSVSPDTLAIRVIGIRYEVSGMCGGNCTTQVADG